MLNSSQFALPIVALACLAGSLLTPTSMAQEPGTIRTQATLSDNGLAKALIGSWRIIEAHRDGKPSELHYTAVTIKHITPTQFIWLSYKPDDRKIFRSMGGSWKVVDGKYLETPQYATQEGFIEQTYGNVTTIGCDIQGDIFTQTIVGKDGSKFIEVWQRMHAGEDSSQIPTKK